MSKLQTLKSTLPVLDTSRVQTMQAGSWRTSDQTSSQRGYGYKWQKAREQFGGYKLDLDKGSITYADGSGHVMSPEELHWYKVMQGQGWLAEDADPFQLLRAALAEIDRREGYEVRLLAALIACTRQEAVPLAAHR